MKLRIVKRIIRNNKEDKQVETIRKGEGTLIIETDEELHDTMVKRGKINIGWKKCAVFNYVIVIRCYKCWGYHHIAKNCVRKETCYKCAENHKTVECTAIIRRCVNCMHKKRMYNLKIDDQHNA